MDIKQELLDMITYQTAVHSDIILSKERWEDMGIDSLDALEIMLSVADKFNITINEDDEDNLLNFNQLLDYIELKLQK
jgi:acyl carrier protein